MEFQYDVRVGKDSLVFSAAHFITYAGSQCERIHGHNYRVEVGVDGPLDENHYVVDFIALRDAAKAIVDSLDHRIVLPTENGYIRVTTADGQTTARFEDRTWSFPADECVLLPIPNTTAELLARWIGERMLESLAKRGVAAPPVLVVRVEENFGQWATCKIVAGTGSTTGRGS